ncbi:MAG: hypothetical protein KDC87_03415 [Planctomycetes bacterium]|nr:hypothetical protein [Planctomycetota bacterium]MCB9871289.1 hypothetical protein [Planctomycetota bacterium]
MSCIDTRSIRLVLFAASCLAAGLQAQTSIHRVAGVLDAQSAPGAGALPGFQGAFREQILIDASRLNALVGKRIVGFEVRRNLDGTSLVGGTIDLDVSLSTTSRLPTAASPRFADNAPSAQQVSVFSGPVVVPTSPVPTDPIDPWSAQNKVHVGFAAKSAFVYRGGTLVLDLGGRPRNSGGPKFWYADFELDVAESSTSSVGVTCSRFMLEPERQTLTVQPGIQIGNPVRFVGLSRPGARSLLLLGGQAIPGGVDLSPLGAPGCAQYVGVGALVGIVQRGTVPGFDAAFANLQLQIPFTPGLLGTSFFAQLADLETNLARSEWSNAAGMTTSNALRVDLPASAPSIGLAVVRTDEVSGTTPFPAFGEVDVRRGPVLRLLYE